MIIEDKNYLEDIKTVAEDKILDFEKLKDKSILLTGATGLINSFLVDVLMYRNKFYNNNIKIYILSRNEEKIISRFKYYSLEKQSENNNGNLIYIIGDVCEKFKFNINFDYIVHGASNTHPLAYSSDPIGTITTNIIGLNNLLDYNKNNENSRIFLMSSVEIYGENKKDVEKFDENYLGYINCNTLRAGYPESKRTCEALAQAYISKYNMDIVIGRFSRVYGPTMQINDSKALSQFIKNAVNNQDIVLKSNGEQYFSYCYVADAVSAMLKILFDGKTGEAYNISDDESNIKLKDLAQILASINDKSVIFEIPDEQEKKGYSTATVAILNSKKINGLGWKAEYDIESGIEKTVKIIKKMNSHLYK